MWGQLSTTCSNVLKQPNGELLVAVNRYQLRTMASKTVDPIDCSHLPPSWAVPPERHVHSINQCNIRGTRTCNCSMRGNHLAYAATQGGRIYQLMALPASLQHRTACTRHRSKLVASISWWPCQHHSSIARRAHVTPVASIRRWPCQHHSSIARRAHVTGANWWHLSDDGPASIAPASRGVHTSQE